MSGEPTPLDRGPHRLRVALFCLLLLALYAAPRLYALRGVQMSATLDFGDMDEHLARLEMFTKRWSVTGPDVEAFFDAHPTFNRVTGTTRWPAGVYWVASPLCALFGPLALQTTQITNLLFSALLVLGVVLLGRDLSDLRTGLWGALFTVLCPALAASTWYFTLDYPLTAMCLLGLWLLLRGEGFSRWGYSLGFAVWSALGMFVKLTYALYLVPPALAALAVGLVRPGARSRRLARAAAVVGLTLGLTLALHGRNLLKVWEDLTLHFGGPAISNLPTELPAPGSLTWLLAVPTFAVANFPWPLLLLALPGLVLLHRRHRGRAELLAFLWGTTVAMTLLANKMERYVQPIYPLICLATAWWVVARVPRRLQAALLGLFALAHGATLAQVHRHPTPWSLPPDLEERTSWMYEMRMPSVDQLAALRRNVYLTSVDLRPLAGAVTALLSRERSSGLLGLSARWGSLDLPVMPDWRSELYNSLFLMVAQIARDRVVLFDYGSIYDAGEGGAEPPLDGPMQRAPLLVIHQPGRPPDMERPGMRLLGRQVLEIAHEGRHQRMAVSLYVPTS